MPIYLSIGRRVNCGWVAVRLSGRVRVGVGRHVNLLISDVDLLLEHVTRLAARVIHAVRSVVRVRPLGKRPLALRRQVAALQLRVSRS